jgi:hypothetical protein
VVAPAGPQCRSAAGFADDVDDVPGDAELVPDDAEFVPDDDAADDPHDASTTSSATIARRTFTSRGYGPRKRQASK